MENYEEQEMELDLRELFNILWKRKWIIILLFILAVTGSYFISGQLPRIYETSTVILVREGEGLQDIFGEQFSVFAGRANRVATYQELLKTRPILEEVIERMDLKDDETGEPMRARSLQGRISIRGDRDTNLITITVEYDDPEMARDIANTLVEVFQEENQKMNIAHLHSASEFISQQLESTKSQLTDLEYQLLEYKTEQGIVFPTEQGKSLLNKIVALETARAETEIEMGYAKASLGEIEEYFEREDREMVSTRTISNNPEVRELRSWHTELEIELAGLLEVYTEEHPKVLEVKKKIDEVNERLGKMVEEITSSRTEAINPLYQSFREEIIRSQTSIIASQTKIDAYDAQIEDLNRQLSSLPEEELAMVRLERESQVTENLYLLLMERQAEVQIQEAMQTADIVVVSPAATEMIPIRPRTSLNMALAGVLALFVGVGIIFLMEFLDTTVKTDKDLEKLTGIPVLGVIPDMQKVDYSKGYGREN